MSDCIFCNLPKDDSLIQNKYCFAHWSAYEVSEGHLLIIPFRHFGDYFEATDDEKKALWDLVDKGKKLIESKYKPDGYNIGINIGQAAGQTIMHLHIHIIPRYNGDMEDPRGGVRGVIPDKQQY